MSRYLRVSSQALLFQTTFELARMLYVCVDSLAGWLSCPHNASKKLKIATNQFEVYPRVNVTVCW